MKNCLLQRTKRLWLPVIGVAAVITFLGCGKKSDNPAAAAVDELQAPSGLTIRDQGNGTVILYWYGSNNEDKFDGYNVYGMKEPTGGFGLAEGKAVELLDDQGNAIDAAKTLLTKFNYDPSAGKGFENPATTLTDGKDFSFLPVHTNNGADPLLPTCKPVTTNNVSTCVGTTAANKGKAVSDDATIALNTRTQYTVTGLIPGNKYCFLVMSSINEGKSVSATSTEMKCVTPKYKLEATLDTSAGNKFLDLRTLLTACKASSTNVCPAIDTTTYFVASSGSATNASPGSLYVEASSTALSENFVAGIGGATIDLGYKPLGFADEGLPFKAPALLWDSNQFEHGGGYTPAGMSVKLYPYHMYVVAVDAATTATSSPTQWYYHWIYVKNTTPIANNSNAVLVEVRLSKNAGDL